MILNIEFMGTVTQYRIKWEHQYDLKKLKECAPGDRWTACRIGYYDPLLKGWIDLCAGDCRCSPREQYCKRKGRKLSFKRALESCQNEAHGASVWAHKFNTKARDWRLKFWQQYRALMPGDFR